jgi:hypothetical protein
MSGVQVVSRKAVTVKGWQWVSQPLEDIPDWVNEVAVTVSPFNGALWICLSDGIWEAARIDDWLIHEPGGVVYVVTAAEFSNQWVVGVP